MLHFLYCYKTSWVTVCVANNYCMEEVWIGYLFYFLIVECMDLFLWMSCWNKCVIQMWGFNNVMTGYMLISKP